MTSSKGLSWRASGLAAVLIAVGLAGCGGSAAVKTGASKQVGVVRPTPAYRVGQYCLPSNEVKYRAVKLTCTRHHLARH